MERTAVTSLPELERALLIMMALLQEPMAQSKWLDIIRLTGARGDSGKALTFADIKLAIQNLKAQGWIEQPAGAGYQLNTQNNLAPVFSIFEYMQQHTQQTLWLRQARDWLSRNTRSYYIKQQRSYYRRQMWLDMLQGNYPNLLHHSDGYFDTEPDGGLYPLCFMTDQADGSTFFNAMPLEIQHSVILHSMLTALYRLPDCPHLYRATEAYLKHVPHDSDVAQLYHWYLLLTDQLQAKAPDIEQYSGFLHSAMLVLKGKTTEAASELENLEKQLKKHSGKRKLQFRHLDGWFAMLAYLGCATPESQKRLKAQVKTGLQLNDGHCYQQWLRLVDELEQTTANHYRPDWDPDMIPFGLDGLFYILALFWQDALTEIIEPKLHKMRELYQARGYSWVAAELDAVIAAAYGKNRLWPDWHQQRQLQPLCQLMHKEAQWQRALNALNLLTQTTKNTSPDNQSSRLCWFVQANDFYTRIEPREQKRNAKGQWSAGRVVALKRLAQEEDNLPFVTAADKKVIACIEPMYQGYYGALNYEIDTEKALYQLVGHPLVFWEGKPDAPIQVEAGTFFLQVKQHQQQYELSLEPEEAAYSDQNWQLAGPNKILVYDFSPQITQIMQIIGPGLTVPAAGKELLLATVSKLAPSIPVQADAISLPSALKTIAPNSTLLLYLSRYQDGLRLQPLVQPLKGGALFSPGKGNALLVGEQAGEPVQTERSLIAEQQHLSTLNLTCPSLQQSEFDGSQWLLLEPEHCLELLSELQDLPAEHFSLVWPEGEPFRITNKADTRDFRMNIRQQGQWLEIEGELVLDQDKVLSLKTLLELVQQTSSRFIPLSDQGYLALSAAFRKQLKDMAALANQGKQGELKLSSFTAPFVAELAEGAQHVSSNKAWQSQLKRLQQMEKLQPAVPNTLQAELRDYQLQGFQWLAKLAHWGVGACLADDMGLGKTLQTLALLLQRAAEGPALVVAPVSVANNWQTEAARFAPTLKIHWFYDNRDLTTVGPFDLVICSYGMLQNNTEQFTAVQWHTLVLDEAQAIKNDSTKRAKAAMALNADFRLALSGTPIENHLGELWSLFNFLNPGLLGTKEQFNQRFATPIEKGNTETRALLKKLLSPFVLRRTKTQVLTELPSRTEITLAVELSDDERHLYEALRQQAIEQLANAESGQAIQVLAEIMKLRRFCCNPSLVVPEYKLSSSKLQVFAETLTEILDNQHKVLVFSQFVDHLALVRQYLELQQIRYQYLDGSTPVAERQKRVNAFQQGDGEVFLISLKAGGSGLNLTAADYVIHLDPWWNPAVEDQASDRAHRIGQTRPVTIYRLVTENTIEQKILALHQQKRELADSLLEGGDMAARLSTEQLLQLLRAK